MRTFGARNSSLAGAVAACWVGAITAGAALAQEGRGPQLPDGPGREIVAVACSQCHALNVILSLREGQAGWTRHVRNMVLRGAQLTPRDFEAVIKYLTNNLGPGTGEMSAGAKTAATPIKLPEGNGRELVESRCVTCHDLERIAGRRPSQEWAGVVANMAGRGAAVSADEAKTITAYLSSKLGE